MSELEAKKRELIKEKNSFEEILFNKEKALKKFKRVWTQQEEDMNDDIEHFKKTMEEKKKTIEILIQSVDDSLAKFNEQPK